MSLKIVAAGISLIFVNIILGIATGMYMTPDLVKIYIYVNMGIGVAYGLLMAIIAFTANGVVGPFMSAKANNTTLLAVLTASGKIKLRHGKEQEGFVVTKDGPFAILPGSAFSWPNGVRGGYGYYKIGALVPPKFNRACTVMKDKGLQNINDVEKLVEKAGPTDDNLIINLE